MIHSLQITDPKATPITWWGKVEALAHPRTFEFKPGLNILWGRNGSGKSTLIKLFAMLFHCEQSGSPVLTETSISNLFSSLSISQQRKPESVLAGIKVDHDGQGVQFFDPSKAAGLSHGGAAFDWDFGMEGVLNATYKGSAGQTTMYRFDRLLNSLVHREPAPPLERRLDMDRVNALWKERILAANLILEGKGEKGPPTILLDEPERSYDLPTQVSLWRFLRAAAGTHQIIVASHSLWALRIPGANYIELSPGYLEESGHALASLENWPNENPNMPKPPPRKPEKAKKGRSKTKGT